MAQCVIITGGTWNQEWWSKIQRSVGPYRVATALEDAGYSTFVLDYVINLDPAEIKAVLKQHIGPDTLWVGFSSTFFWFPDHGKSHGNGDILKLKEMWWTDDEEVRDLITWCRQQAPQIKTIYGGTKAEFFMGSESAIDYYVMGLADHAIIDITRCIQHDDTTHLVRYEQHGDLRYIDCRDWPEPTMDQVRTKWWLPHFNIMQGEALSIEFARGCIFKCRFCTYPLLGKKKGTYLRSAEELRDDLWRNYDAWGTTDYFITDDTVNDDTDKLIALEKAFRDLPFRPRFTGFFRLDLIRRWPEQADILLDMGVIGVFFGIETLNHKSGQAIGKGLHPEKIKESLNWLAHDKWRGRVNIGGGMILGLPYDDYDYFEELKQWSLEPDCPMHHIQFYPLHLNRVRDSTKRGMYVSEFNLHPEIYGYEFPGENNYMNWELPSQGLSYTICNEISKEFNKLKMPLNKIAGFEMCKWLNIGIDLQELYDKPMLQLVQEYPVAQLNLRRLNEYRGLLGLPNK